MPQTFPGQIWLKSEPDQPVAVDLTVDDGRVVIMSGAVEIVDWPVNRMSVSPIPTGFVLRAGDEELIFSTHRRGFHQALASQKSG